MPAGASISMPSIVIFGMGLLRRPASCVLRHAFLDHRAEMPDQTLDRPGRRVAERADSVAFDLLGDFLQHVDDAIGKPLEDMLRKILPRDRAREVRKEIVMDICDKVLGPEKREETANQTSSVSTNASGFLHWNGKEWVR